MAYRKEGIKNLVEHGRRDILRDASFACSLVSSANAIKYAKRAVREIQEIPLTERS